MAWLRIDDAHHEVFDLLLNSARVASVAGRAATGPFVEQRQVVVYAAALGYAAGKQQPVKSGRVQIRDSILFGARGAIELAFCLAYQREEPWSLNCVADSDMETDKRINALQEYAAGGLQVLTDTFNEAGGSLSATELMLRVHNVVSPPPHRYVPIRGERREDPLIAALRRTGKLTSSAPDGLARY